MTTHYDWKASVHQCSYCGWTGPGHEAKVGETFNDGAEYHCPRCDGYFGYVEYPLLTETLVDPRADDSDRMFAAIALSGVAEGQAAKIIADAQRASRNACEASAELVSRLQIAARKAIDAPN